MKETLTPSETAYFDKSAIIREALESLGKAKPHEVELIVAEGVENVWVEMVAWGNLVEEWAQYRVELHRHQL